MKVITRKTYTYSSKRLPTSKERIKDKNFSSKATKVTKVNTASIEELDLKQRGKSRGRYAKSMVEYFQEDEGSDEKNKKFANLLNILSRKPQTVILESNHEESGEYQPFSSKKKKKSKVDPKKINVECFQRIVLLAMENTRLERKVGFLSSENRNLDKENKKLSKKLEKIDFLEEKIRVLKEDNYGLKQDVETFRDNLRDLEIESERRYADYEQKIRLLASENERLTQSKRDLQEDYDRLLSEFNEKIDILSKLEIEFTELEKLFNEREIVFQDKCHEVDELQDIKSKLEIRIEDMDRELDRELEEKRTEKVTFQKLKWT